jgi:predicted O-linked N-acetylglucosamine transferase (SPINDLY family)
MPKVLNVGGNSKKIPIPAHYDNWDHHLLDIDPTGEPDIVCDARKMSKLDGGVYDAIYCSHNLEHYEKNDVVSVLQGFLHVLKPTGFVEIRVPDIVAAIQYARQQSLALDDELYRSPAGPITLHDLIYGYGKQIEQSGEDFYAHKTAFTEKSLRQKLLDVGFRKVYISLRNLEIHAFGFIKSPAGEVLENLQISAPTTSKKAKENKLALATSSHKQGDLEAAEQVYRDLISADPQNFPALQMLALLEHQSKNYDSALDLYRRALDINDQDAGVLTNYGVSLAASGHPESSLDAYHRALKLNPEMVEAYFNLGNALKQLHRMEEAVSSYEKALALKPDYVKALNNLGTVQHFFRNIQSAIDCYDRALRAEPESADVLSNKGRALEKLGRYEEAAACLDQSLAIDPSNESALNHRARLSSTLKDFTAACEGYLQLTSLNPEYEFCIGNLQHSLAYCCDWKNFEQNLHKILEGVRAEQLVQTPLALLADSDDTELQLICARIYEQLRNASINEPTGDIASYRHKRIRLAYVSADLRNHAVSYLMAGVFEQHDRTQFEVFAISLAPAAKTTMGERIASAFDHFIDVSTMSDKEVVELMRDLEIDIAVDLMGYTGQTRFAIFKYRVAPVQVSYLGFPATTGAQYMDYIVADNYVIPKAQRGFYSESIAYLNGCFQANDDKRQISSEIPSRQALDLPENGFVFCCFNNSYKITPTIFDIWMNLLREVDGSVLWLLGQQEAVRENLQKEARLRGIEPGRIIFSSHTAYAQHLARLGQADLFLDTFPFNAGTTASDALWAGLPIVTCSGRSFASRMAGSLLTGLGLEELVTDELSEYQQLAQKLALNPTVLASIRERLLRNRSESAVFNTQRCTHALEMVFLEMWRRQQGGKPPKTILSGPEND